MPIFISLHLILSIFREDKERDEKDRDVGRDDKEGGGKERDCNRGTI